MKAKIILNSYFTAKNTICYEKICVKWIFHNFHLHLGEIFFSKLKFFENFDIQPQKFLPSTVSQDNKPQLQEVWHS